MDAGKRADQAETQVRLNRFLSELGICSRREADRLIEAGRVTVEGRTASMGQKVQPGQSVEIDGKDVRPKGPVRKRILAVHKPVGVVCTTDRRWGDPVLEDLLDIPERVFPVGRLDKLSDGLILMTNQGDLANEIMKACNYHEKEYVVKVDHPISELFLERMRQGVFLKELNVKTRPCEVSRMGERTFRIVLTQGLNRQIRRMCGELGYRVVSLTRIRILNVQLDQLPAGGWRDLTEEEGEQLKKLLYSKSAKKPRR
ncbi:MAG: pseudouridine synthase [Lachnospiraceae bacterium]|nr:pseudouridine synthase [Lachnospiraceae bacterium]